MCEWSWLNSAGKMKAKGQAVLVCEVKRSCQSSDGDGCRWRKLAEVSRWMRNEDA